MIQVEDIAKAYAGQRLFRELSWRIPDGARIGLVGPNGVGKTTLCRLLAGLEEPDAGRISRPRETTVGYLSQEVAGGVGGSVLAAALSGFDEVWRIEYQMEEVAAALSGAPNGAQSDALTARYGDLQHRFEALGGYRLETAAKAILGGLGFRETDFARPLAEFSGGWRMRAALARLLLLRPSLLLLDEPTNHLDIESLEWLEGFLADYDGTVVLVSHDRYFLNRMVTSIAELGPSGVTVYPGDYDDYLVERAARRELLEAQARNQAKRIAEIERFIERFRYQATKARQVQSRIKMLERIERVEVGRESRGIRFAFPAPPRTGRRVAALRWGRRRAWRARRCSSVRPRSCAWTSRPTTSTSRRARCWSRRSRRFRARSSSSRTTATSSTVWPRRSSKSFAVSSPVTSATTTTTSPPRHAPRPTRRRARGWGDARPLGTPLAPSLPPPPRRYPTPARREHPERSQSSASWRERRARGGIAWRGWRRGATRSRRGSGRSARRSAIPRSTPMASGRGPSRRNGGAPRSGSRGSCTSGRSSRRRSRPMSEFWVPIDPGALRRERAKARELRASPWWKRRLADGVCYYCRRRVGPRNLTMDHVVPMGRGGRSTRGNVVPACKDCNSKKQSMVPVEWQAYLRSLGAVSDD